MCVIPTVYVHWKRQPARQTDEEGEEVRSEEVRKRWTKTSLDDGGGGGRKGRRCQ